VRLRSLALSGVGQAAHDLVTVADALTAEPAGLIGLCIGGMFVLHGAASGRFTRIVSVYGMPRLPPEWRHVGDDQPVDVLRRSRFGSRVLGVVAGRDSFVSAADAAGLSRALVRPSFAIPTRNMDLSTTRITLRTESRTPATSGAG
jgi:dienelactone hydrolase